MRKSSIHSSALLPVSVGLSGGISSVINSCARIWPEFSKLNVHSDGTFYLKKIYKHIAFTNIHLLVLARLLAATKTKRMTKLSVNINKIATLRNARGGNLPDVQKTAIDIQRFGANGITVHPRPDERHIRYDDVFKLKPLITTEFNIEGYPSKQWLDLVLKVKPHQATLVPDPPDALTSTSGWNVVKHCDFLKEIITELKKNNIRTSIFIETDPVQIEAAAKTGTNRIELYTENYVQNFHVDKESAIAPYVEAANIASRLGIGLNAGHGLNLENLNYFYKNIPNLLEVSIGHALISDALYFGLENTVQLYLRQLQ
jgi:pyridoxine 5-phosphate synthase